MSLFTRNSLQLLIIILLAFFKTEAQICTGSLGDPVVNINFGSGSNPGPPLSVGLPNLNYIGSSCPDDGFYTITTSTSNCFNNSWHTVSEDHTPGDNNGYMMLINASFNSGDFYIDTVKGLCGGTTYEFAAWVLNVLKTSACNFSGITPNLTFNIESTSGSVLGTFQTGAISQSGTPGWQQYGLFFKTPPTASNIVLRITNNAPGGCGNDIALDDITFRPCGPMVQANIVGNPSANSISLCTDTQSAISFTGMVSGGYTAPAFQWQVSSNNGTSWQDIGGANTPSYTRLPTTAGTYLYRLAVAEGGNIGTINCRVASNPIVVTVNEPPVTNATNDGAHCPGTAAVLGAGGGTSYQWTGPNGFTAIGQSITINNGPGKYYVKVTNLGCSKTDSTVVIVHPKPVAAFSASLPACVNSAIAFNDQSTIVNGETITNWQWNFGDGIVSAVKNPSHVFTSYNTYPVQLRVGTANNCFDTISKAIVVNPLPAPRFGLPEVCLSDPFAAFTDSSSIADHSENSFSYLWNFGDPLANASFPNTSSQKNPQHHYQATGVYPVQLTVTSNDGCKKDTTQMFTVNGAVPMANLNITSSENFCSNKPVTLTNLSSVNFGSITRLEIYWDDQNNQTLKTIDEFPAPNKQYSFAYPSFAAPLSKNVQVKLVAFSGISCVSQTVKLITLKASPQVLFDAMQPVCAGLEPFALTAGHITNSLPGTGVYSGSGINTAGLFDPQLAAPGSHLIRFTYTADNSCSAFGEQSLQVLPQPGANAGPDRTVLEGGFIVLAASASGPSNKYLWTPNTGIENNTVLTPKVYPLQDQDYRLTVTSADGCSSTDDVFVKVLKTPVVPNAFSPNGDGINDTWIIRYLDSYVGVELMVFDRYGRVVFQSKGYQQPWDGTKNGKPLPVGTYYYTIDRKIEAPKLAGSVTILR